MRVYLNGTLELQAGSIIDPFQPSGEYFFGGRSDNHSNWEGRVDETALFERSLSEAEISRLGLK